MTIREALLAELDELSVKDATIEKVLADHGLVAAAEYTPAEHEKNIDLCAVDVFKKILIKPDLTEGGYSERWDRKALLDAIKAIYTKWAIPDPTVPKLRAVYKA